MCLLLTGAEAEGSTIPEAVPVEGVVPGTQEPAKAATEPAEVASQGAPGVAEEKRDEVLPESSLEVVVRLPKIQDVEPIHSAPMSGAPQLVVVGSSFWRTISSTQQYNAQLGGDAPGRAMDEGKLSVPLSGQLP
jgi:hypothetical protein